MILPTFIPDFKKTKNDRVVLALPARLRLLYLVLGGILMLILVFNKSVGWPLLLMFGFVLGIVVLSEDKWIFDLHENHMWRHYGLVVFPRSWGLSMEGLASIELDTDAWDSGVTDPTVRVPGAVKKGWCSLNAVLVDGKALMLFAAPGKKIDKVRKRGMELAEAVSRPFITS